MLGKLVVVGVNHDSASVELREQIAFAPEKVPESLSSLIGVVVYANHYQLA